MSPLVGADTSLLTLQNGMGNVENLQNLFGQSAEVIGGLCFTCINRTAPGMIESLLPGYVQFGQLAGGLTDRETDSGCFCGCGNQNPQSRFVE